MIALKYLFLGIFVKIVTGLDDTITNVPIIAAVTRTRMGKIAFSVGTLIAMIIAILVSIFFAGFLRSLSYYRYLSAALIFILAFLVFFNILVHNPRTKAERSFMKKRKISFERFFHLMGIGFLASIVTVADDIVAFLPLFLENSYSMIFSIMGILIAVVIEIFLVIYFAEKIAKIPYKEKIASAGLVVLGILILAKIL